MAINEKLREYREAWDAYVDAWLVVRVGSPDWVYRWRLQAEHAMLATGRPGMTDEQVRRVMNPTGGFPDHLPSRRQSAPASSAPVPGCTSDGHTMALSHDTAVNHRS